MNYAKFSLNLSHCGYVNGLGSLCFGDAKFGDTCNWLPFSEILSSEEYSSLGMAGTQCNLSQNGFCNKNQCTTLCEDDSECPTNYACGWKGTDFGGGIITKICYKK